MIYVELVESNSKIEKDIINAFLRQVNDQLKKNASKIESQTALLVATVFRASKIYEELTQGNLRKEFGFPAGQEYSIVEAIVGKIVDSVKVNFKPYYNLGSIQGEFEIYVLKSDLSEILGIVQASVDLLSGDTIPWLEWLLLAGDQVLIVGYEIQYGVGGRSGQAFMVPKVGGFWKVPAAFSGTAVDNWITRTLYDQIFIDKLGDIINQNL